MKPLLQYLVWGRGPKPMKHMASIQTEGRSKPNSIWGGNSFSCPYRFWSLFISKIGWKYEWGHFGLKLMLFLISSRQVPCLRSAAQYFFFFFFLWFYFIFILYRHFHKRGRVFLLSIYYPLIIDICNNHDLLLVTSRLFTTSVLLYFLQNARESNVSFKILIQYRLRYKHLSTTYLNWISVP